VRKKETPLEPIIFTAEQIAAFSTRNFYDEYLALHPQEKVCADLAMTSTDYALRKRAWAEQEKVRLGLAPDPSAYDRGFAEFAADTASPASIRRPDAFDVLAKNWEPPKK
jgi:hypothetical protein